MENFQELLLKIQEIDLYIQPLGQIIVLVLEISSNFILVHVNFGENDFEFNVKEMIDVIEKKKFLFNFFHNQNEKKKEFDDLDDLKVESEVIRNLVVSYLIHQGYKNTVKILDQKNSQFALEFRFGKLKKYSLNINKKN